VDEVEGQFCGIITARVDLAKRGVDGDADFTGGAGGGVAGEGDDVGGGWVGEEVGVELGEGGVGEEDERELTVRRAQFRFSIFDFRLARPRGGAGEKVRVEGVDHAGHGAAVEAQAGVAIGDLDFAEGHAGGDGSEAGLRRRLKR